MCSDSVNIRPENKVPDTSDDELIHLAYVSTQTRDMKAADLIGLLTEVRGLNESRNISGLLLHKNQSFFQVIEGSRSRVRETFDQIMKDQRHEGVEVLFDEPLEAREFSDWQMGFLDLDGIDVSMLRGYSNFFDSDEEPRAFLKALSRGERLALLFRDLG
ncbi:MAG: BLUF domain-containing protein [Luminiphilus sp.]|nr:BLUF domain-containing protein [Luminiphilus sp.]